MGWLRYKLLFLIQGLAHSHINQLSGGSQQHACPQPSVLLVEARGVPGRWEFTFACPDHLLLLLLLPRHLILAAVRGREVSQMAVLWFLRQQIVFASSIQLFIPRGHNSDDICWGWRAHMGKLHGSGDMQECVTPLCVSPWRYWSQSLDFPNDFSLLSSEQPRLCLSWYNPM